MERMTGATSSRPSTDTHDPGQTCGTKEQQALGHWELASIVDRNRLRHGLPPECSRTVHAATAGTTMTALCASLTTLRATGPIRPASLGPRSRGADDDERCSL